MFSLPSFSKGITFVSDKRYRAEERDKDGKKIIIIWFGTKQIAKFEAATGDNFDGAYYYICKRADKFVNDCHYFGYANSEKMQALSQEGLEQVFSDAENYESECLSGLQKAGEYFSYMKELHEKYGVDFDDCDKLDKFFAEED